MSDHCAKQHLFRQEVIDSKRTRWYGDITIAHPLSVTVIASFFLGLAISILLFLVFGEYSKRSTVQGRLMPVAGQVSLTAPQTGRIAELHVTEGKMVAQGEVIMVLSLDRDGKEFSHEGQIAARLQDRKVTVMQERAQQQALASAETTRLNERLKSLHTERSQIDRELHTQGQRLEFAEQNMKRYRTLAGQGFVSSAGAQGKEEELLEQRARLQTLERTQTNLEREITSVGSELAALPLRTQSALIGIARTQAGLEQETAELQGRRVIVLRAPQAGSVHGLTAQVGQFLSMGQSIATLLPDNNTLVAELYAPSRALGFVREGQAVRLRYAPYPYQKFGQHGGAVLEVTASPIATKDLPEQVRPAVANTNESLFRIKVKLEQQSINAYGKPVPLTAGMQVEADIELDRRRLVEWVFEPLLSLKGRVG